MSELVMRIDQASTKKKTDAIARAHFEEQLSLAKASIELISHGGCKPKATLLKHYVDLCEIEDDEGRRAILITSALTIAIDGLVGLIMTEIGKKLVEPRIVVSKLMQILGAE